MNLHERKKDSGRKYMYSTGFRLQGIKKQKDGNETDYCKHMIIAIKLLNFAVNNYIFDAKKSTNFS